MQCWSNHRTFHLKRNGSSVCLMLHTLNVTDLLYIPSVALQLLTYVTFYHLSICAWNWIRKINFRCYLQLFRFEFKFQKLTDRPNAHLYSCQSSCCWWWYTGQFWGNRGGIWSCVTGAWHPRPWGQKQTKSPLIWRTSQHLFYKFNVWLETQQIMHVREMLL